MRRALIPAFLIVACGARATPSEPRDPIPPFHAEAFAARLASDAETFSVANGDWLEDQGDAPFYGLAFYAHMSIESRSDAKSPAWLERAEAARRRAIALTANADFFNGDIQEMVMSTMGLIDAMDARGDRTDLPAVDGFVDRLDKLIALLGWYVESGADKSWALATYGPTSISALIALMNAQYAYVLGGDRAAERAQWAKDMQGHIADHAWNGSFYEFGLGRKDLDLYPNVAMIALHARLFELTKDEADRERALALYAAIQPLKLPDGRYYSAYSAAAMGAKTHDYSTLSSQNYVLLALMLLYEITGQAKYVVEMDGLVDALATELHGTWCLANVHKDTCAPACEASAVCVGAACTADACHGGMLHHWIDGRIALPSDAEFFCSGCNLQMLYVMWYRQKRLR